MQFTHLLSAHHAHLLLSSPPVVTETTSTNSTQRRLYSVHPSLNSSSSPTEELPNVAFVIKMSSGKNLVSYIWQASSTMKPVCCTRIT